jgi:hypothetical protein
MEDLCEYAKAGLVAIFYKKESDVLPMWLSNALDHVTSFGL